MFNRLLNSPAAQRAAATMLGAYLAFALRSTRWRIEGGEHLAPFCADVPVIVAFWHECLPLMPAGWAELRRRNPKRRGAVLISRHRDGRFIAAILARFAVDVVHGSSSRQPAPEQTDVEPMNAGQSRAEQTAPNLAVRASALAESAGLGRVAGEPSGLPLSADARTSTPRTRDKGGAAALRALMARLAQGDAVIMTPDGPRGPARQAAPGIAQLAALSGAPILPAAARLRHRVILKTWDRMILPLPFGRGAIVCLPPLCVTKDTLNAARLHLAEALTQAAARSEALCGL